MTPTADVVVIGGGVHGCSLAFHLAEAGRVVLLEKKHIASGPTAQSGAMIRALFETRIYVDLVIASTRMFERWNDLVGGNAGFVQQGFLRITHTLDAQTIGGDLELSKAAGEPYEILNCARLSRLVPAGEFKEGEIGILFPNGGYADPYKALSNWPPLRVGTAHRSAKGCRSRVSGLTTGELLRLRLTRARSRRRWSSIALALGLIVSRRWLA